MVAALHYTCYLGQMNGPWLFTRDATQFQTTALLLILLSSSTSVDSFWPLAVSFDFPKLAPLRS